MKHPVEDLLSSRDLVCAIILQGLRVHFLAFSVE